MRRFTPNPYASPRLATAPLEEPHIDCDTILSMLARMTNYFHSMVDPRTDRFYYRCLPEAGRHIHGHSPIRDLASSWNTANCLSFWGENDIQPQVRSELYDAVVATIEAYSGESSFQTFGNSCAALSPKLLREQSTIAHSAFLILSTVGALRLPLLNAETCTVPIEDLVNGILSMQRDNGAFTIQFGSDDIYQGIEFYPGEAMLALVDALDVVSPARRQDIVAAVRRAFVFYADYYRQGHVRKSYISFFGNWQVNCFAKLIDVLREEEEITPAVSAGDGLAASSVTSTVVTNYVLELCDAIVSSDPWQRLHRGDYDMLATVEIACGLEAIAEGNRIALKADSEAIHSDVMNRVSLYWRYVEHAVQFLLTVQDQLQLGAVGFGGLCHGIDMVEQRLDVTGHAVNALIKVYEVHNTLVQTSNNSFAS